MNGKQMLERIVAIDRSYRTHQDPDALAIDLLEIIPELRNPGIAQMGQLYRDAVALYNGLITYAPSTSGLSEITVSNRQL